MVFSTRFKQTKNSTRLGRVESCEEFECVENLMREFRGCRRELDQLLHHSAGLHVAVFEVMSTVERPLASRQPGKTPPVQALSAILAWPVPNRCIHVVFAATDTNHRREGQMERLVRTLQARGLPLIIHAIEESMSYWQKLGFTEELKVKEYEDKLHLPSDFELGNTSLMVSKLDKLQLIRKLTKPSVRGPAGGVEDSASSSTAADEMKDEEASSKEDAASSARLSTQRPSWWPPVCAVTGRALQTKLWGMGDAGTSRGELSADELYRSRFATLRPGMVRGASSFETDDSLSSFPSIY